uniref:SERPIN domain-containing protein n=1 Tax=Soboliphyme baturini TaxID=241478 RepID=A0A183IYS9_9BILA
MISLENAFTDFMVHLYQNVAPGKESVCISPVSITIALAALFYGSSGHTKQQLKDVVFRSFSSDHEMPLFAAELLLPFSTEVNGKNNLVTASHLYCHDEIDVSDSYREVLVRNFDASVVTVTFSNAGAAIPEINDWVAKVTHGKIEHIIAENSVDALASLMITNVVHYKNRWEKKFSPSLTRNGYFHVSADRKVSVKMMSKVTELPFAENEECKVLALPCDDDGNLTVYMFLPKERFGLSRFEQTLTTEKLLDLVSALKPNTVQVQIPKFAIKSTLNLDNSLKQLGLGNIFSADANFSGISHTDHLRVSSFLHATFVELDQVDCVKVIYMTCFQVDEEGGEPSASAQFDRKLAMEFPTISQMEFIADHGFLFALRMVDRNTLSTYPLANFSVSLYQHVGTSSESLCLSPLSVSLALAMIFYGSGGNTKSQIRETLIGSASTDEHLSTYMSDVMRTINNTEDNLKLYAVNRLYIDQKYDVLESYKTEVHDKLNSEIVSADFSNPNKAASEINTWVAVATHEKITQLVSADSLGPETRLMIVNAIYFKNKWIKEFSRSSTSKKVFYKSPGHDVKVDMMHKKTYFMYGESSDCQVLEMQYKGRSASMIVLLPNERYGLKKFEQELTAKKLVQLLSSTYHTTVAVQFPKFELRSKFELNQALQRMGITDMFTGDANLSRISGKRDLHVSSGTHEAYIKVDEKGTEAAAVTGFQVRLMAAAVPPREIRFIADHPFMFAIIDKKHKNILFMGRFIG